MVELYNDGKIDKLISNLDTIFVNLIKLKLLDKDELIFTAYNNLIINPDFADLYFKNLLSLEKGKLRFANQNLPSLRIIPLFRDL